MARRFDANRIAPGRSGIEVHHDFFIFPGGQGHAGIVGDNRQPAAAAVDEHGKFDLRGSTLIKKLVERGLDRAAGKQHVVDQNHGGALDVAGNVRRGKFLGNGIAADVVAVERDIDGPRPRIEPVGEAAGQLHSAIGDAQQQKLAG